MQVKCWIWKRTALRSSKLMKRLYVNCHYVSQTGTADTLTGQFQPSVYWALRFSKLRKFIRTCYSEFGDVISTDDMDADVISFEASRADLTLLDTLQRRAFSTHVGPGVHDIHSPRIPSEKKLPARLQDFEEVPPGKRLINPDCGLKTREQQNHSKSGKRCCGSEAGSSELAHEGR